MENDASLSVLILTAGFGDGHDSAARSLAAAVRQLRCSTARVEVVDLFDEAAESTTRFLKWGYRFLITHAPGGWKWLYDNTQHGDFTNLWWDHFIGLGRALERRLAALRPQVVLCTYPVYPLLFARNDHPALQPERLFTVVTDSLSIHPSWWAGTVDRIFVTDGQSAEIVRARVGSRMPVDDSGFAVSPVFADFPPRPLPEAGAPFRLLYFATTATGHAVTSLRSLLQSLPPGSRITVGAGRHAARLQPALAPVIAEFPALSVTVLGWTRDVPRLLREHDAVLTKAGGATTHECLAAGVPVLVNFVIPGQEEGNVTLLESLGCGRRLAHPTAPGPEIAAMLSDGTLRSLQESAIRHLRPDGALTIIRTALAGL